ncbi:hypothetical protein P9112_010348 [Eukaryota sp. TZLM1-RC]
MHTIQKKSNKVSPLAVGELFNRISVGLALSKVNVDFLINLNQYGVRISGGREAIVHSIRSNIGQSFAKMVDLLLDSVLCSFHFLMPAILAHPYILKTQFISERGVRQGDPLGTLLFSTALVHFATQLSTLHPSCNFKLYLDDLFVLYNDHDVDAIVRTVSH